MTINDDLPGQLYLPGTIINEENQMPATKKAKRKAAKSAKGRKETTAANPQSAAVWKCDGCNSANWECEWTCLKCGSIRRVLYDQYTMLVAALEPDRETEAVWHDLAGVPTSDAKLTEAIHAAICRQRSYWSSTVAGPVAFVSGPEHEALIGSIAIWFGRKEPPASDADGEEVKLAGADLLNAVRSIYGIPQGAESGEPSAESNGSCDAADETPHNLVHNLVHDTNPKRKRGEGEPATNKNAGSGIKVNKKAGSVNKKPRAKRRGEDDRVNEHGVYVRGLRTIDVPVRAATKHTCRITVVEGQDGRWRTGFEFRGPMGISGHQSGAPRVDHEGHTSEAEAIARKVEECIEQWESPVLRDPKKLRPQAVEDLKQWLADRAESGEPSAESNGEPEAESDTNPKRKRGERKPVLNSTGKITSGPKRKRGQEVNQKAGSANQKAGSANRKAGSANQNGGSAKKKTTDNGPLTTDQPGARLDVPLDQIVPSPFQPRTVFDADALRQLGESMRLHGQTTDCLVRAQPADSGSPPSALGSPLFELIGGERRFRAAGLVGLDTLACRLIVADDAKARELAVFDNLDREDLSEIDRIRAYDGLLESGVYDSQKELAQAIGIEPASLSNLLRILKLPAEWLEMISQEILPVTHARYVIPWAERPAVLADLKEVIDECIENEGQLPIVEAWKDEIGYATIRCSRPLAGHVYCKLPGDHYSLRRNVRLTKKDKARDDLDVAEVDGEKRAFNVDLWEELQAAGEARAAKRAKRSAKSGEPRAESKTGSDAAPDPAAEKARRAKQREQFAKRLWTYKIGWLQRQLAEQVAAIDLASVDGLAMLTRLVCWFLDRNGNQQSCQFAANLSKGGVPIAPVKLWQYLADATAASLDVWLLECVTRWMAEDVWSYSTPLDDATVAAMADSFGVDLARDWECEREYLELLNKEQLAAQRKEWKMSALTAAYFTRAELIDETMQFAAGRPAPKALVKAKRPAGM